MTNLNDQPSKLQILLDGLCNGTLNAESHDRLQELLKSSEDARREYLAHIDLHFDLRQLHSNVGDLPSGSETIIDLLQNERSFPESSIQQESTRVQSVVEPWWHSRGTIQRFAVAASLLVVASSLLLAYSRYLDRSSLMTGTPDAATTHPLPAQVAGTPESQNAEVLLLQAASAKLFGEPMPAVNSRLQLAHEYALSEGLLELRFPSGATTIIESPALFVISTPSSLLVKTGKCSVHAPEGAQGFRVDTPLGNVVDLGTRFAVHVQQSGDTDVQVVEGEAELIPVAATSGVENDLPRKINLRRGQANRLTQQAKVVAKKIEFAAGSYTKSLPDRLISFDATEDSDGAVDDLLTVTVQRGGKAYQYRPDEMTGIDVVHFTSGNAAHMVTPAKVEDPAKADEANRRTQYLDRDHSLCSGLINPGGSATPLTTDPVLYEQSVEPKLLTPGIGFRFQTPLVNSVGPELVLFELQTIVNSEQGDAFHLSPLHFSEGLHSQTFTQYDIDLVSPESKYLSPYRLYRFPKNADTLMSLLTAQHYYAPVHTIRAKVLAIAIDLSDLGYKAGERSEGLFLQDANDDVDHIDPIFIGGLPPVP